MKILFFVFTLLIGTCAWASQELLEQNSGMCPEPQCSKCPNPCQPPQPVLKLCHARMVDCTGRQIQTYWGRAPQFSVACKYAVDHCNSEAEMGYGGYGARCYVIDN